MAANNHTSKLDLKTAVSRITQEEQDSTSDGIDRRGFLKCMAWVGTGMFWSMNGGILCSVGLSEIGRADAATRKALLGSDFTFVQISDSHIGFSKPANPDVTSTLQIAIDKINQAAPLGDLLIHTGDLSHLCTPDQFDTLDQVLLSAKINQKYFVPGEHDMLVDNGKPYFDRYGKGQNPGGWYSFDHKGVHFIALVNVAGMQPGGLGDLGPDQLDWLKKDVATLGSSTPIVVFAHVPLWTIYPAWGWGTDDSAQALAILKRFGSVTVLNGHIHQTLQKVEGAVTFHTAMSTAFPQPAPGQGPSPGPMTVPADQLKSVLGITNVNYIESHHSLGIVDTPLQSVSAAAPDYQIRIRNFMFVPASLTVPAGTTVTWQNDDDEPHTVVSTDKRFKSDPLDTGDKFTYRFTNPGAYTYFCSVHPYMTATVNVQ